ncbi:helix-turn-helix domain-containing protein [Hydrogenophaga sp. 2FB]|uniref:helix-turn-helix transcriptional regulator n=1 Tax=Hydrogenophaga sp. 2FB TaxID=2502187 RepID=UPI0010F89B63|nr:helix-turn-helix domain-containing protein [Hydrogenophaga sp. 2FB]
MNISTSPPLLYRINVAEAKLGVSRSTIYRLIEAGTLNRVKIGKRACGVTAASVHAMISDKPASDSISGSQPGSQPAKTTRLTVVSS